MHDADGRVAVPEAELSRLRARLAELEATGAAQLQSQAQLKNLLNQLPCVAWTTDLDLKFTSSIGAGLKGLSLRDNEVVGRSLFDFFQTSDPRFTPSPVPSMRLMANPAAMNTTGWANVIW